MNNFNYPEPDYFRSVTDELNALVELRVDLAPEEPEDRKEPFHLNGIDLVILVSAVCKNLFVKLRKINNNVSNSYVPSL